MTSLNAQTNEWFEENLYTYEALLRSWLACRFPGIKEEIEDLVQETFVKVLNAHLEDPLECPKSYLFATARNLAVDSLRRKKILQIIPLVETDASFVSGENKEILLMLTRAQEQEMLTAAIKSLPKRCRDVIILRKIDGLSQKAIAEKLGISVNTVQVHVSVGVRKLRDYFRSYIREINR